MSVENKNPLARGNAEGAEGTANTTNAIDNSVSASAYQAGGDAFDTDEAAPEDIAAAAEYLSRAQSRSNVTYLQRVDRDVVRDALSFIDPNVLAYPEWIQIKFALKSIDEFDAEDLWMEWNARYLGGDPRKDADEWQAAEARAIGIGTLFYWAKQFGWERKQGAPRKPLTKTEQQEYVRKQKEAAAKRAAAVAEEAKRRAEATRNAQKLWNQCTWDVNKTPIPRYLTQTRHVDMPQGVFRFLPQSRTGRKPAPDQMLAQIVDFETGEFLGLHRTALHRNALDDWFKLKDAELGWPEGTKNLGPSSGLILLHKGSTENRVMFCGEGIETTLSMLKLPLGVSEPAVCSLVNSGNYRKLPALPNFDTYWIATDIEKSGNGAQAAKELAIRLARAGKQVKCVVPVLTEGETKRDINDIICDCAKEAREPEEGRDFTVTAYEPGDYADVDNDTDKQGDPDDPHSWPDGANNNGTPHKTVRNTMEAMRRLGITAARNVFKLADFITGPVNGKVVVSKQLDNTMPLLIRDDIANNFGFDPGKDNMYDAILTLAGKNEFHPVLDFLNGLEAWDGVARLEKLYPHYFGAPDTELNHAISKIQLVAAVRRVKQPGCKFDTMTILEGPQGTGKSSALRTLVGPEFFSDADVIHLQSKDQIEQTQGVWVHEVAELVGMSKADVTSLKNFLSRQTDKARPAYGRVVEEHLRQFIFIGTTNENTYLRDTTGNRRFWPVETGEVKKDEIERDRNQLWAEAVALEAEGFSIVLPEELWGAAKAEQDAASEVDFLLDDLRDLEANVTSYTPHDEWRRVATEDIRAFLAERSARKSERAPTPKRIADTMRKLGWESIDEWIGDRRRCGYQRALVLEEADKLETALKRLNDMHAPVVDKWTQAAMAGRQAGAAMARAYTLRQKATGAEGARLARKLQDAKSDMWAVRNTLACALAAAEAALAEAASRRPNDAQPAPSESSRLGGGVPDDCPF